MGSLFRLIRARLAGRRAKSEPPYEALAFFYDRMMSHVDYTGWAAHIHRICSRYAAEVRLIIDCGCGTGTLMSGLAVYGYTVWGFDRSLSMLKSGAARTKGKVFQADLRAAPLKPGADVLLCLYDTIQYLQPDELAAFLAAARDALGAGGLLIFDVVTENHIRDFWDGYREYDKGADWRCSRRGWYEAEKCVHHTEILLESRKEKTVYTEHHRQYIYPLGRIKHAAAAAGWQQLKCLHEFTFEPGSEASGRVHFVLKKEEQ